MKKLFEPTEEELEQMILDKELFIKLFQLFDSMSKRGKHVTIETLIMYLVEECAEWDYLLQKRN